MTPAQPRVKLRTAASGAFPAVQKRMVEISVPEFSHDDELPLKLILTRRGLCRRLTVKTTEEVWYQDAVLKIVVPAGFVSDLASIPRGLWFAISPWDIALEALFHDLIYRHQPVQSRVVADAALLSMMEQRGQPWYVRWPVYLAVRLFGGAAWRANAAALAANDEDEVKS